MQIELGAVQAGKIAAAGEADRFSITLEAGVTYRFALVGTEVQSLRDPVLALLGADGSTVLGTADGGLQSENALLTFTATTSGTYQLQVTGKGNDTGAYRLSATDGAKANLDAEMVAGVIDSHWTWQNTRGEGLTLSFGFRENGAAIEPNFVAFSASQQVAARAILQQTAELTGLKFTDVNRNGLTDDATLLMGNYADGGGGGYGWYPGSTASGDNAGDMWINTAPVAGTIKPGSWNWTVIQHELGHNLGLSHPGSYNGGNPSYAGNAEFVQDSEQYSVMSYFGANNTGGPGIGADSWMLADVIALQNIYGRNMTTRTGDTTYGFGGEAGSIYDFTVNKDPLLTIWDAGGIDVLNLSQHASAQRVDLREGRYSSVLGYQNNLAIAPGARIENALGGLGSDEMTGNGLANRLKGNGGADSLMGGNGADRLLGDAGADLLQGGRGRDILFGGDGADTFVLGRLTDSAAGSKRDVVQDFDIRQDSLLLEGIDANRDRTGDQDFAGLRSGPAKYALWTEVVQAGLLLRGDVNGDGIADFSLLLKGITKIGDGDILG